MASIQPQDFCMAMRRSWQQRLVSLRREIKAELDNQATPIGKAEVLRQLATLFRVPEVHSITVDNKPVATMEAVARWTHSQIYVNVAAPAASELYSYRSGLQIADSYELFKSLVKAKAPWDYKPVIAESFGL